MSKRSILLALVFAAAPLYAQQAAAAVPIVDSRGVPAPVVCPATTTQQAPIIGHFDKVVFGIGGKLIALNPNDQPALDALPRNTELDVKISDNPKTIADLKGKVLSFVGADPKNADNRASIRIINVLYATAVCNPKGW